MEVLNLRLKDRAAERTSLRRRCREMEVKLAGATGKVEYYEQMLDAADDLVEQQGQKLDASGERFAHLSLSLRMAGMSLSQSSLDVPDWASRCDFTT